MNPVRAKAWETRRAKYGPSGHGSSYSRPSYREGRALALVVRLHREEVLSEGQCCAALAMDRIAFRKLVDALSGAQGEARASTGTPDEP